MNRKETTQLITFLASNYNTIAEKTIEQKQLMIDLWQECLGDLDFKLILQSVKKVMITSKFPPTIAEIRENAVNLIEKEQATAIEAWNEAYNMICNGLYMTEEQFEMASPEVKKFFGNVRQVSELARTDIDIVNTVTKGQFLKQYDIIKERQRGYKLLPENMKQKILQLQSNVIKEIGG